MSQDAILREDGSDEKSSSSTTSEPLKVEKVEIEKSKLDLLLDRVARLESAADKSGLARYDGMNKEKLKRLIKLCSFNGKVVISWGSMVKDIVEKDPKGYWFEDQIVEITLEDDTKEKMPYVIFSRRYQKIPAVILSEKKVDDEVIFEVETLGEGKKYTINKKFVN